VGLEAMMADTKLIGFWTIFSFMLMAPIVAVVYAAYSFGYWMHNKGWPQGVVYPYALLFGVLNTLHNWTVCTILFREFPREFFTTQRLKRHKNNLDPSKRELADMLGGFLNGRDPGHY